MPRKQFTFLHATPEDRGSHVKNLPKIKAHAAHRRHGARFRVPESHEEQPWTIDCGSPLIRISTEKRSGIDAITNTPPLYLDDSSNQVANYNIPQIFTSLDPFIRLPCKVTSFDRYLLHFYFNEGRRLQQGTSKSPSYCPSLYLAQELLQTCPVYVSALLVTSEYVLCCQAGSALSKNYYLQRARAYKAMNTLLSMVEMDTSRKLLGLIQLSAMEAFTGINDLWSIHLRAMEELVGSNGGLLASIRPAQPGAPIINPIFYVSQYASPAASLSMPSELKGFRVHFEASMELIESWALSLRMTIDTKLSSRKGDLESAQRLLTPLIDYSEDMITAGSASRPQDQSCPPSSHAFFFCYLLCMIPASGGFDSTRTIDFLSRAQQCIVSSTDYYIVGGATKFRMKPRTAAKILYHVYQALDSDQDASQLDKDLVICQAAIAGLKYFTIMRDAERHKLVKSLYQRAFVIFEGLQGTNFN